MISMTSFPGAEGREYSVFTPFVGPICENPEGPLFLPEFVCLLVRFAKILKDPYFCPSLSVGPFVCWTVCLLVCWNRNQLLLPAFVCVCVCLCVCRPPSSRPSPSVDFYQTWPYGPLGDLVVRVAYWSRSAPQGGRGGQFKNFEKS